MNFKGKILILFAGIVLFMTACAGGDTSNESLMAPQKSGANDDYGSSDVGYNAEMEESTDVSPVGNGVSAQSDLDQQMTLDRKLIKNATLFFETDTLANRKKMVDAAVQKFDAYVEHEEQYTAYESENIAVTLRVPSQHFDPFMEMITQGVGKFDSKAIQMDDVTEEYVDVEARIRTKKELKARFLKLLDKAETIAKIMEVEREITALQAEIESYEGRLQYLSASVQYATINLTYYQTFEVPIEFDNKFATAFFNGWEGTVWFFVGVVSIWPFLLIVAIILIFLKIRLTKYNVS